MGQARALHVFRLLPYTYLLDLRRSTTFLVKVSVEEKVYNIDTLSFITDEMERKALELVHGVTVKPSLMFVSKDKLHPIGVMIC
jgi:hypothetical protein